MKHIIGVDFDNTVVSYSEVMYDVAVQRGLVPATIAKTKQNIRESIRALPNGEFEWQRLQADVYGPLMARATLTNGVDAFFRLCRRHQIMPSIVSHKTEYAARDVTGTNMRAAAIVWMEARGFFEGERLGLSRDRVYFESTREKKIERIRDLGCTHFVDDLLETFLDESFPSKTQMILYSPWSIEADIPGIKVATTWQQICEYVFV